jgi:hypothetical protein
MKILLVIAALLLVYFLTRSESYTNGATSSTITSDYDETVAVETPDMNQAMIFATRDYLQKYMKLCGYCVETRQIKKFINRNDQSVKYQCTYLFLITGGSFPYGVSVNVELAKDPVPTVLFLSLQPLTTKSDVTITPYTDEIGKTFLSYDEIIASVKPKNLPTVS